MSHKCRRYWGLDIQRQSALDFTRYNMAGKSRHVSVGQQRITAVTPFSCMRLMWRCTAAVESPASSPITCAAKLYAKTINGWMVEDGLEAAVSEGHGTIAVELLARGDEFDAVTIPLGNGAMLNGMARWLSAASPATRVLGVCAAGASAMEQSWRHETIVTTARANTIADGIAVRVPIAEAVSDMQDLVDDVLLVKTHTSSRRCGLYMKKQA
jgi:cysteine synthase